MSEEPKCGKCGLPMTPQNAKVHPEYFLHDACLPDEMKPKSETYEQQRRRVEHYGLSGCAPTMAAAIAAVLARNAELEATQPTGQQDQWYVVEQMQLFLRRSGRDEMPLDAAWLTDHFNLAFAKGQQIANGKSAQVILGLQEKVAELEAENSRLRAACQDVVDAQISANPHYSTIELPHSAIGKCINVLKPRVQGAP